jgi:ankyrin repeat protein
VWDALY